MRVCHKLSILLKIEKEEIHGSLHLSGKITRKNLSYFSDTHCSPQDAFNVVIRSVRNKEHMTKFTFVLSLLV